MKGKDGEIFGKINYFLLSMHNQLAAILKNLIHLANLNIN